jgi:PPOX class probable F420-dependent enzyme
MRPLTAAEADLLDEARTAVLATIDPTGRPRLVPICFVVGPGSGQSSPLIYSPIDDKPKTSADPHQLARVRDIAARPEVTLLVQRWDEDWNRLAWLRFHGFAVLLEPAHESAGIAARADAAGQERDNAIAALRAKYPQYAGHDLESRPLIRITVGLLSTWAAGSRGP